MTDHTCETCDFWDGPHDGTAREIDSHRCHRYPPSVPVIEHVTELGVEVHLRTRGGDAPCVTYPMTYYDEWCGEWRGL